MPIKKPPLTFSIIIPALNEQDFLPLLLKDLARQSFKHFEVIVVDGESEDATLKKAKQFEALFPLKILSSSRHNVSHQRNMGATQANSPWIIFMDADNRLPRHFLQGIRYQLTKHPKVDIFSCWMDSSAYTTADKPLIQLANFGIELYSRIKPQAPGALIGVRTSICKNILFDESLALSEDHEFVIAATKEGYSFRVFHDPKYVYSLRRFKQAGTLKVLRTYAQAQIFHLTGQKITAEKVVYPMNGGSNYLESEPSVFQTLHTFFTTASRTQLNQAQKLWNSIKAISSEFDF